MNLAESQPESKRELNYHLLINALKGFGKNPSELDEVQYTEVHRRASRSFELEALVLSSPEARDLIVTDSQLQQSMEEVAGRYSSPQEFLQDLEANGLDESLFQQALHRELIFDSVMQRVSANAATVSDLDIRLFYEMHHDRFAHPEKRTARHILITVNADFAENSREAALTRIEQIAGKLQGREKRFSEFARRHSECPTAMEGGKLGDAVRGQLYAELDTALFSMEEGSVSDVIESELGFHILLCEKIHPAKRVPLSKVMDRIRDTLQERQCRNCQKAWLSNPKNSSGM
ncbi:MAG: nitrogen fixation protein NifM [Candidatus Sedimenticola endophacoides]